MISSSAITDRDRDKFLRKLDATARAKDGLVVSTWEWNFIAGFFYSSRPSLWFTEPRRVATDKMRMKYGAEPEIGMPFPVAESRPANLPEADADGCQFVVREEGRQQPCNEPAAMVRQNGFRYCAAHAETVQRDLQRRGKTMILFPI